MTVKEEQQHLEGTDYAKVDVVFKVTGMVVALGDELMKDGDVRKVAKVKVTSVEPA